MTRPSDRRSAFAAADRIPGWLTEAQAITLFDAAATLEPGARVVEIGSHLGRSAIMLAAGLPAQAQLTCVDPWGADWRYGLPHTQQEFVRALTQVDLIDRISIRATTSQQALAGWQEAVDLVYIDGKHDAASLVHDLGWSRYLRPGASLFVHDAFSSIGVTLGLLWAVTGSRRLRYVGRVGSLAQFQKAAPSASDRGRLVAQLPWFARNVVIKVLLRLRLRGVAARMGHLDEADPY